MLELETIWTTRQVSNLSAPPKKYKEMGKLPRTRVSGGEAGSKVGNIATIASTLKRITGERPAEDKEKGPHTRPSELEPILHRYQEAQCHEQSTDSYSHLLVIRGKPQFFSMYS